MAKSIILIIFDTLRADFLSCYNNNSIAETPNLDYLSSKGAKINYAYSTAPETASSHATMFTGLYPHNHGVASDTPQPPLRQDVPTLASWLSDSGYDTYGIPGPGKMGSDYGYDRGFDTYNESFRNDMSVRSIPGIRKLFTNTTYRDRKLNGIIYGGDNGARQKFSLIKDAIQNKLDKPYFLMCNFIEAHSEYNAPRPYMERKDPGFTRPKYSILGHIYNKLGVETKGHSDPEIRLDRLLQYYESMNKYHSNPEWLRDEELKIWKKWYAAELEYLDKKIGELIDFLQARGEFENTILLFTSDHGELFGEHNRLYHHNFLWDKLLHVPLISYGTEKLEKSEEQIFSHVDLFPTVCDLVGIKKPDSIDGKSLISDPPREYSFAEIGKRDVGMSDLARYLNENQKHKFDRGKKAMWDKDSKYIYYSDNTESLFSMPSEQEVTNPPNSELENYNKKLINVLTDVFPSPPSKGVNVSQSTLQNLKELGYR